MGFLLLLFVSFVLLGVPLDYIALQGNHLGSWRIFLELFTHQLGHANLSHLLGNYMFVAPYALYVEHKLGTKNFLKYFFVCGLLAAGTQVLAFDRVNLIGSSGADFGIFAMACALFNRTKWDRLASFLLLGFSVMLQFIAATHNLLAPVAYWAHFGGALGGLALVHFFVIPSQSRS